MQLDKSRVSMFHQGLLHYFALANNAARDTNEAGSKRGQVIQESDYEKVFGYTNALFGLIDVISGLDRAGNEKSLKALDRNKLLDVNKEYKLSDYKTEEPLVINQRAISMPDNDIPLSIEPYKIHVLKPIDNVTMYACAELFTVTRNEAAYCQSASWTSGLLPQDAKRLRRQLDAIEEKLHLHSNLPPLDFPVSHPGHETTTQGRHEPGAQAEQSGG